MDRYVPRVRLATNNGENIMQDNVNVPGGTDTVGHSAVQAWSAGDIFPAVIRIVESYSPDGVARYRAFDLLLDGKEERFSSYDDAATVARYLLRNPLARAAWQKGD